MKFNHLILIFAIKVITLPNIFSQSTAKEESRDYVVLKNGHVVIGSVTNMVDSFGMEILSELGTPIFIPYKDIRRAHRKPPLINLMDATYGEIGITYGTPGGINFVIGGALKKVVFRVSGMHYNENFSAFQTHIGYKITDDNRRRQAIGFSYGRLGDLGNNDWVGYGGFAYSYTGPALKLKKRHHAWFAEIGYGKYFSSNKNDNSGKGNYGPMIQLGFLYRFIEHAPRFEEIPIPQFKKQKKKRPRRPKIIKEKIIQKKEIVRPKIKREVVKNITKVEKVKIVKRKKPCPKCPKCPECPECEGVVDCPVCPDVPIKNEQDSILNIEKELPLTYLLIRDNGIPDGDIISIKWNGQLILSEFELTKSEEKIFVELSSKKKNLLTVIAHNMGNSFPNTSFITFVNEKKGKKKRFNVEIEVVGEREFLIRN